MKKHWIEFHSEQPKRPLTFWVHREVGSAPWYLSEEFDPPRQSRVTGQGYPVFHVEIDGFTFEFASLAEIDACIETLSQKVLPRPADLAKKRGLDSGGANSHWLSRLPGKTKSWRYREKAIGYLRRAAEQFRKELE